MARKFETERGDFGTRLVLTSAWSQDYADYMCRHNINEITVNYARGFQGESIDFLSSLPFLRGLLLISYDVKDVSPINDLHELRSLAIGYIGKSEIDFWQMPNLQMCSLMRRIKYRGLYDLKNLENLSIMGFPEADITPLLSLSTLKALGLTRSSIRSLQGISTLSGLKHLVLSYMTQLASLDGIEGLSNMEVLDISTCRKLTSIAPISRLTHLKKLLLVSCGDIESLTPIAGLNDLETLMLYQDTNIVDGDLSVIDTLAKLKDIAFMNRRHYTHVNDDTGRTSRK